MGTGPVYLKVCFYGYTAAGVAFAGLLVAIIRSKELRDLLLGLVQNALGVPR